MFLIWAITATIVGSLAIGYILGSEIERYRNKESALGYLAETIEEKVSK